MSLIAHFFNEIGKRLFFRVRIIGRPRFADFFQEGGAVLHVLLKPGGIGRRSRLFGQIGGLKRNAVEPVADFMGVSPEELRKFLAREIVRPVRRGS